MKKIILLALFALFLGGKAFADAPFKLVSSEKKTLKFDDLVRLEKDRTAGKKDGSNLTFTKNDIRLIVVTGPEDDMLSYRVLGMRNPTIVIPAGATLRILFVNRDVDMKHDVRFGGVSGDFPLAPEINATAGSARLDHKTEDEVMQAEEIVIKSSADGTFKYFCSVRGHAKGGMWGNIAVGVKPPANVKQPEKTQHVHTPGEKMDDMPADTEATQMQGMNHAAEPMKMSSVSNVGDPMERESSGTAWGPDASPMYARMKMYEDGGMLMLMGTAFLRYTNIGSSRDVSVAGKGGRSRGDAPSMFMLMYSRPAGSNSQIGFRVMASADPLIERGYGYPLLYQSGEQYKGEQIHDRQHPHDLFSELAFTYSHKFDAKRSFYLYAGLPGEPALGPPMYLHRTSGMNNPDAPIGHHWQDATHITFGVVTGGFSFGKAKIEASAFNGREPDDNRWNIDKPRLDSFSGRFSFNPTKSLAIQVSHSYLKNPERLEPEVRILRRTTASVIYNKRTDENHNWASTFVWGQNYAERTRTNAILFESNYDFYKNAVFGRFERVQKSGHELVLDHPLDHSIYWIGSFSAGFVRDLVRDKGLDLGVGTMVTINTNPKPLVPVYGGTTHAGWQAFLRLRPSKVM